MNSTSDNFCKFSIIMCFLSFMTFPQLWILLNLYFSSIAAKSLSNVQVETSCSSTMIVISNVNQNKQTKLLFAGKSRLCVDAFSKNNTHDLSFYCCTIPIKCTMKTTQNRRYI